jgi:hypothetical protein
MECKESPFEFLRWCIKVICTCSHKITLKSYKFADVQNLQEVVCVMRIVLQLVL